jgi:hypothetical protein
MALGFDIWQSIMTGYTTPTTPPTYTTEKKASEDDAKSMNSIFCGLSGLEFVKVMLDTPTTLIGGVNECGALFPKTSLLHKNSSISIQNLFITHCCHL